MEGLLAALKDGAAGSKTMDQKGERMIKGDFTPESHLTTTLKDVRLMLEQGQRFGVPMFLTSNLAQVLQAGVQSGYAESDPSAMIEILRGMAGLPQRK
jgi:3-hydroxyisobutyrate dehydrogenase-like beta-hydroxyacid dehydrogenase